MTTIIKNIILTCLACCCLTAVFTACSDEPSEENFYTFTGETMTDYLNSRSEYSDFAYIVSQAGLNNLLSAYGRYTCFLPDNEAVGRWLTAKGVGCVESLTQAECDTLARTHIINNMYTTAEMGDGTLNTANLNKRYIQISHGLDEENNSVVYLNRSAYIIYAEQDDSVQNGIVQPISEVLEMKNSSLADIIAENDRISMFSQALEATGLADTLYKVKDERYNGQNYEPTEYKSNNLARLYAAPTEKNYGFTAFIEPDDVYLATFSNYGITAPDMSSRESVLQAMYTLAVKLYDPVYGSSATYPDNDYISVNSGEGKTDYTNRWNALNMFVAYHILNRDCLGWNLLTPKELEGYPTTYTTNGRTAINIKNKLLNPCDWYETLLQHTMMKVEQATVAANLDGDTQFQRYINRRINMDNGIRVHGAWINPTVENQYVQDGPNGRYFYIDKVIAFDYSTQNVVFNDLIRMDMSTLFPELMTMNIRQNGNPKVEPTEIDYTFANGKNYYLPQGFLDNVTITSGFFAYNRPCWDYDCYEGDEMNLFGDYDITFRLPPVPIEGTYQIRLGAAFLPSRGIAQVYFDGKPQGIPLDLTMQLNDVAILGDKWSATKWAMMPDEDKAADQKMLKNIGYYRGPLAAIHGKSTQEFIDQPWTYRRVLCTVHIDTKTDHYLRIRKTSTTGNEFMMDYIEFVPKSVYGVMAGQMESDL